MAARHVRAVQKRRREFTDRLDYELLCIIATDIGRDDSPARTSYRGMAERAGCHYNTVGPHIKSLEDDKWIIIEQRGKYHHYHLNVDCDNPSEIVTTDYDNPETLSQFDQRLSQIEETLSQLTHIIVTIAQRAGVTEVSEDSEVSEDPPQTPPRGQGEGVNGFWDIPDNLNNSQFVPEWAAWLAMVDERDDIKFTETQAKATLSDLSAMGSVKATAAVHESVLRGWRSIYPPKPGKNGHHKGPDKQDLLDHLNHLVDTYGRKFYSQAMEEMRPELAPIVREMGDWENVCRMNDDTLRISFYEAYNAKR